MNWQVYMILCDDGSLYTGISTDPQRRMKEHASGTGAKYFRGRHPLRIVYQENGHNRGSATRREAEIKRLPRPAKELLIAAGAATTDHNI
jgi:putative endonuclease